MHPAQVLLALLILFNDPFAVTLYSRPSLAWSTAYALFLDTFLSAMLLFWLSALDGAGDARHDGEGQLRRKMKCLCPKTALVVFFWVVSLAYYTYFRRGCGAEAARCRLGVY